MKPAKPVRVCVVGDSQVGKTSLITAAATESFPDNPPPVLPPTRIGADATSEGVPLIITDTSSRPEDKPALEVACLNSDVIILAYDTGNPRTLKRITEVWVPELQRLGVKVPLLLVGCKSDLRPQDQNMQQVVVPVLAKCKEIESCLDCSAKNLIFVSEVFYYAVKAVVHPVAPLFDVHAHNGAGALRPLCIKALMRIFSMCDADKDGTLNDAELNKFQVECFSAPLQPEELAGVKKVVSQKMPQGVSNNGLTLPGFLFLHALFIERGRLETTWAVLRKFGYNNELRLSDEALGVISFLRAPDQVVELTREGVEFLEQRFAQYDKDADGRLSPSEQDDMFACAPSRPWEGPEYEGLLVEGEAPGQGDDRSLTKRGFLSKWAFTTAIDPRAMLEHFLLLGFRGDPASLFCISRQRRAERKSDAPGRRVFQVLVMGGEEAGKSSLLRAVLGQGQPPTRAAAGPASGSGRGRPATSRAPLRHCNLTAVVQTGAASGDPEGGGELEATLILREVDDAAAEALLSAPAAAGPSALAAADAALFVFDSTDLGSLRVAMQLLHRTAAAAADALPCVLLAAKDDLGMSPEVERACAEACAALSMPMPIAVSLAGGDAARIPSQLLSVLRNPDAAIPLTPSLKAARRYNRMLRRAALYSAGGMLGALALYGLIRMHRSRSSQHDDSASGLPARLPAVPRASDRTIVSSSR
ncbi:mitochondrial Rho GTPase 2 [Coccomyxa sp. Obi]|nr:mitochondrial Rho GTPase 2 [Coccomyxa sp. Obi]